MKNLFTFLLSLFAFCSFSQAPQLINYQGAVRNADGSPVEGTITVEVTLRNVSADGPVIYSERHSASTSAQGLFALQIGNGTTVISGDFSSVDWGGGSKFLQVRIDPAGGQNYTISSTSQLVSVPYSMYAQNVLNADDADADPTNELELPAQVAEDAGAVLVADGFGGVMYSVLSLDDADADPTNELELPTQSAADDGLVLVANGAGGVSFAPDNTIDADADPTNELISGGSLNGNNLEIVDAGGTTAIDISGINSDGQTLSFDGSLLDISGGNSLDISSLQDDADADPTNELISGGALNGNNLEIIDAGGTTTIDISGINSDGQTLSFDGSLLEISGGNSLDISSLQDDADADPTNEIQDLVLNGSLLSIEGGTNQIDIGSGSNTDNQTMAFDGTNLSIAGGNVVDISGVDNQNAEEVAFDNLGSGLSAISVQAAISELDQGLADLDQNFTDNSWTAGGNSFGVPGVFGTSDDNDLALITNSVELVRFGSNGNVGIGQTNPAYALDVFDVTGTSAVRVQADGTGNPQTIGINVTASGALVNEGISGEANGAGNANYGVSGLAQGATLNRGILGRSLGASDGNIGVFGIAQDSENVNRGIVGQANGNGNFNDGGWFSAAEGSNNTGVYGQATGVSDSNIGLRGLASGNSGFAAGVSGMATGTGSQNYGIYGSSSNSAFENVGAYGEATGVSALNNGMQGFASGATNNSGLSGTSTGPADFNFGVYADASDAGAGENTGVFGSATGVGSVNSGIRGEASGSLVNHGIFGNANGNSDVNYGVTGYADGAAINRGMWGRAQGISDENVGVFGRAQDSGTFNRGVIGEASGSGATNDGGWFYSSGATTNHGVYTQAIETAATNIGLFTQVSNGQNENVGIRSISNGNGANNYASDFQAYESTGDNVAVFAQGTSNVGNNYGLRSMTTNGTAGTNYALYAEAANATTNNYAGYFEGDVTVTGTLTELSDRRMKREIRTVGNALRDIQQVRGTTYYWRDKGKGEELQFGVIAQEIENVFPQLIRENPEGLKSVNYIGLIPILLEAIKEQQKQISKLKGDLSDATAGLQASKLSIEEANLEIEAFKTRLTRIEALLGAQANR